MSEDAGLEPGIVPTLELAVRRFYRRLDLIHKLSADGGFVYFEGTRIKIRSLESRSYESIKVNIFT